MEKLEGTLEELNRCFTRMLDLSQQELQLAEQAGPESDVSAGLFGLMQEREELAGMVDSLIARITSETGNSDIVGQSFAQKLIAIQQNDRQTRQLIGRSLNEIGKKLQVARASKKAYKAYAPSGTESAWFIDKKK
ncbi:MAG TPA: flagellar protein FliT [Syntrophomonadaceae bacterium]|nr:flagellar protein FliT [Syntrophomonadaceae bacterium]